MELSKQEEKLVMAHRTENYFEDQARYNIGESCSAIKVGHKEDEFGNDLFELYVHDKYNENCYNRNDSYECNGMSVSISKDEAKMLIENLKAYIDYDEFKDRCEEE